MLDCDSASSCPDDSTYCAGCASESQFNVVESLAIYSLPRLESRLPLWVFVTAMEEKSVKIFTHLPLFMISKKFDKIQLS